ncbi:MAG: CDP-alcohol phosphatidyltransferase family protein [Gammaproteobacteria bacterium]|nr:CDP-alcohol phosphatidyltransferase family protein [Gammaproteobacteria bacterium]
MSRLKPSLGLIQIITQNFLSAANTLTVVRLALAPAILWAIVEQRYFVGLFVFTIAVITDVMDGRLARRQGTESKLGGLLDHATDCIFVVCGLFALSRHAIVPLALSALVAVAFIQYMLDSGVLKKKGLVPNKIGRWNGIAYFVLVAVPLVQNSFNFQLFNDHQIYVAGWAMCAMTAVSMLDRVSLFFRKSRPRQD